MLGIEDPQIWVAYVLAIGFALGSMAYGLLNWHKGGEEDGS